MSEYPKPLEAGEPRRLVDCKIKSIEPNVDHGFVRITLDVPTDHSAGGQLNTKQIADVFRDVFGLPSDRVIKSDVTIQRCSQISANGEKSWSHKTAEFEG